MELPRPLLPWASYLDLLPREVALGLGPLIQRLDLVIGTLSVANRNDTGDPDGFDGIARRGTYERLLLSDWLLADELPEEFSRRAAMGEHTFLQLAQREPVGPKNSLALFDSGPNQWGTPRIAHIAALIVLARRSQAAGAHFAWGILQTPEANLFTEVTPATITRMRELRQGREATNADLVAWRQRWQGQPQSDFWVIGGEAITKTPGMVGGSHLSVADVYEPGVRRLTVQIPVGTRKRNAVSLELPEDAICTRILRDPLETRTVSPVKASAHITPSSNFVFAVGGSKLLARSKRKTILSYSIPNSPHAPVVKPKQFQSVYGNTIIAAGRMGKATLVVSVLSSGSGFRVEALGSPVNLPVVGEYSCDHNLIAISDPDTQLCPCFEFPISVSSKSDSTQLWIVTPDQSLFHLSVQGNDRFAQRYAVGVEAIAPLPNHRLAYADKQKEKRFLNVREASGQETTLEIDARYPGSFFGFGGPLADERFGFLAFQKEERHWQLFCKDGPQTLVTPHEMTVVGVSVVEFPEKGLQAVLVLLSSNRRVITLLGRTGHRALPRSPSPITNVTVSTFSPQIAYSNETGDVFLYSIPQDTFLYRLSVEEDKP